MDISDQMRLETGKYLDAFNERRWDDLSDILEDSFTYFTDNCTIQNKKQFLDFMSSTPWIGSGYTISGLEVTLPESYDLAIVKYNVEFKGSFKGISKKVNAIETTIFKKIHSDWKIIHSHTSNK